MGSIELKMTILSGLVGGVLMVLAEGVALHSKISKFRIHLRELYQTKRFLRLFAEIGGVAIIVLIQPVVISMLIMGALNNLTPQFSAHAEAQLRQQIKGDNPKEDRPLRGQ